MYRHDEARRSEGLESSAAISWQVTVRTCFLSVSVMCVLSETSKDGDCSSLSGGYQVSNE